MWIKFIPFILLFLGIVLLTMSVLIQRNVKLRRAVCTEPVSAIIAGVTKYNIYDSDGPDTEICTPIYNYIYDGNEYTVSGNFACRACVGTSITIFIAPSNPRVLYNPTEDSRQVIVTFRVTAIVLLVVAAVACGIIYGGVL